MLHQSDVHQSDRVRGGIADVLLNLATLAAPMKRALILKSVFTFKMASCKGRVIDLPRKST